MLERSGLLLGTRGVGKASRDRVVSRPICIMVGEADLAGSTGLAGRWCTDSSGTVVLTGHRKADELSYYGGTALGNVGVYCGSGEGGIRGIGWVKGYFGRDNNVSSS